MKKLWGKIKVFWAGRKVAVNLISIKSKWKEPTFWATLLSNALTALASYKGMIPPEYAKVAIWANAILNVVYTQVRAYQKAQSEGIKPYKTSSEIIMGLLTMANGIFINAQASGVAAEWLAPAIMMTGGSMVASRDNVNMEPEEVKAKEMGKEAPPRQPA
jgi:hypothetical protein